MIRDALRLPLRTAGLVGVTFGAYGALEVETALHDHEAERARVLSKWVGRYGRALLALYGVDVLAAGPYFAEGRRYPGRDAAGRGRVFVMNHRSGLDIPVTLAFVDATVMSKADVASLPVLGRAARRAGTLFVDRENKRSGAAALTAMTTTLESGRAVMVYPEGSTFEGDALRAFKPGAFSAAMRAGAEIVPVGIAYVGAAASFGEESLAAHMARVARAKSTRVGLVAGEPIRPEATLEATRDAVKAAMAGLVARARALVGESG